MTADAVVIAARADGHVDLEFRPRLCDGCAGACLWKRIQSTRLEQLKTSHALSPGTEVLVALPERRVVAASLLLHGVPLAALLLGALLGMAIGQSDAATLAGATGGLALAVAAAKPLGRRLERATLARLLITPKS